MTPKEQYEVCRNMVEAELATYFTAKAPQERLYEAMRYSLLAGGKRIRPILTMKFAEAVGGSLETVLPVGCAVEMLHTYSLIHDDLPCMDNDTLRRGKPTNHVIFGECTATLAGDALQAAAFETVLNAPIAPERALKAAQLLAHAAGENGICGGQILDMDGETKDLSIDEVTVVHELKTASMIKAACLMGIVAGGGSEEQYAAAEEYAEAVGLAFQIRDDILDVTATVEELGKPIGSDAECGKTTFYTLLGLEKCEKLIEEMTEKAINAVKNAFDEPEFLIWLAELLAKRKN